MFLITVFEKARIRIFEYTNQEEALQAMRQFDHYALLTYTN